MAKPENPGNGNQGSGNDESKVVIVRLLDNTLLRFEGIGSYRVEGGSLFVGTNAIAPRFWMHVWIETLPPPEMP